MHQFDSSARSKLASLILLAAACFVHAGDVPAAPAGAAEKEAATALEHDVVALLATVDPAADLKTLQKTLAPKLAAAVEKQFAALKPGEDSTVIESTDKRFVVVVIGDAPDGTNGRDVRAESDAELLLVVGGRAGARATGGECYGGTGHASASKGIAIALGGVGGHGNDEGVGGGGGGAAGATGTVGAIALGGQGGTPGLHGGPGGNGSGVNPTHLDAILQAAKNWDAKR